MYHIQKKIDDRECSIVILFNRIITYKIWSGYEYYPSKYYKDIKDNKLKILHTYDFIDPSALPSPIWLQYLFIGKERVYEPLQANLEVLDSGYQKFVKLGEEFENSYEEIRLGNIHFTLPEDTVEFDSEKLYIIDPKHILYDNTLCEILETSDTEYSRQDVCFYQGEIVPYMINLPIRKKDQLYNIFHFPGSSVCDNKYWMYIISQYNNIKVPRGLTIITFATDENESPLIQQCKRCGVSYINASKDIKEWDNRLKIPLTLQALKQVKTKYVCILDGYDVVIQTLDKVLDNFKETNYRILFNATNTNFPNVQEEIIPNRDDLGAHKYLNAGACIGYTTDVKRFYKEVEKIRQEDVDNPFRSEQLLVRKAFAKYSQDPDQRLVFIDNEEKVFFVWNRGFKIHNRGDYYELIYQNTNEI